MENEVNQEHEDKNTPKGDDDRSACGGIELNTQEAAQCRNQSPHGPTDSEPRADSVGKEHGPDAGNNEITEDQQDAGDGNR